MNISNVINSVEVVSENCFKVNYEVARKLAIERRNIHVEANNGTERWCDDQYRADTIGIAGELAFAKFSGLDIDLGRSRGRSEGRRAD